MPLHHAEIDRTSLAHGRDCSQQSLRPEHPVVLHFGNPESIWILVQGDSIPGMDFGRTVPLFAVVGCDKDHVVILFLLCCKCLMSTSNVSCNKFDGRMLDRIDHPCLPSGGAVGAISWLNHHAQGQQVRRERLERAMVPTPFSSALTRLSVGLRGYLQMEWSLQ